jgi:hypothetical protein
MRHPEFGFDTGEHLMEDLIAARALLDVDGLQADAKYIKIPMTPSNVAATTEFFIQMTSSIRPDVAGKLVKMDAVRRAAYGLDSVALVKTHPKIGVAFNDYELSLISRNLDSDIFTIFDLHKDNRADSFLMVNHMAATKIMNDHPSHFDTMAMINPREYIFQNIVVPLRKGSNPPDTQYGLLSGFPEESVKRYPDFDRLRRKYPELSAIYDNYLCGNAHLGQVDEVIMDINASRKDKNFLCKILSDHSHFNDRYALISAGFFMLSKEDQYYGERREHWFRHLDSIYKPIMFQLGM